MMPYNEFSNLPIVYVTYVAIVQHFSGIDNQNIGTESERESEFLPQKEILSYVGFMSIVCECFDRAMKQEGVARACRHL